MIVGKSRKNWVGYSVVSTNNKYFFSMFGNGQDVILAKITGIINTMWRYRNVSHINHIIPRYVTVVLNVICIL